MCVFVMLSILQSQFTEKGFKKSQNSGQNVVLLLFLFTLDLSKIVCELDRIVLSPNTTIVAQ